MNDIRRTLDIVEKVLRETLMGESGIFVDRFEVEQVINRGFSQVAFLRVFSADNECRYVMKKTIHHPANRVITERRNQAVVEFDILQEIYPKFNDVPRCNVPKPILVIPEEEIFLMEFVEGQLLGDLFVGARYFSSRKAFRKVRESYYSCGEWLKYLHRFTGMKLAGKEILDSTLERCEQKLKIIEKSHDSRCPPDFVGRVRNLLSRQIALLSDDNIQVTGRHGDFGNWNTLVGSDGVTVFDFLGYQDDMVPIDLIKMLINLEDEKSYLFYKNNKIECLRGDFIAGYGTLPDIPLPILTICETLHRVCCLCARIEQPPVSKRKTIEHNISFRKHLVWLMNDDRESIWPIR